MSKQLPFLRYAALTDRLPNKHFTLAYDCRFLYLLEGQLELCTESETFCLAPDSLVYYPSGIEYLPRSVGKTPARFVTVNFDFDQTHADRECVLSPVRKSEYKEELLIASYRSANDIFKRPFMQDRAAEIRADMLRLCAAKARGTENSWQTANSILSVIINRTVELVGDPLAKTGAAARAAEYVASNYMEDISVKSVAAALGYHPYYLGRVFSSSTGESLHRYINRLRLQKSEELLIHTELSVGQIAAACGFKNADHFSALLRRDRGLSPTALRARHRMI